MQNRLNLIIASLALVAVAAPAGAAEAPTFAADVAPILYEECASCHRPGDIAPMSLLTYREVRPWRPGHQGQGGVARDAAVARGPPGGVPIRNSRGLTPGRDRHHRRVGRRGRAPRRRGEDAAAAHVLRQRVAPPERAAARPHPAVAGPRWRFPPRASCPTSPCTRRSRSRRTVLRERHRDAAVEPQRGAPPVGERHHPARGHGARRRAGLRRRGRTPHRRGDSGPPAAATRTPLGGATKLICFVPGRGFEMFHAGVRQAGAGGQGAAVGACTTTRRAGPRSTARASASGSRTPR